MGMRGISQRQTERERRRDVKGRVGNLDILPSLPKKAWHRGGLAPHLFYFFPLGREKDIDRRNMR